MKKLFFIAALGLLGIAAALILPWLRSGRSSGPSSTPAPELAAKHRWLEAREAQIDKTVWAREILAQDYGRIIESLWDSLNRATNKLRVAGSFPVGEIVLGNWSRTRTLPHGIESREPEGTGRALTPAEWRRMVEDLDRDGWRLGHTEFRHNRFETDQAGHAGQSHFYFSAHLSHARRPERASLRGNLMVEWSPDRIPGKQPAVKRMDATGLTLTTRAGQPPFEPLFSEQFIPPDKTIDPLILNDLDGDGLSEIILAGKNLVYRRHGPDRYQPEPLAHHPPGLIFTALIADFDRDGNADLLCAKFDGLSLFKGSPRGKFDHAPRRLWSPEQALQNAMVLTAGDVDHDGDLDLFLGQYRVPTLGQVIKPHYYEANDSYPSYLLLNDGQGNFSDATTGSGLEQKRRRRVFSASFADLDDDQDLDLLIVSDFAGADLFRNDGRGHFTDVTQEWVADPQAFGMAHALADFNADGRLDFLMIGMNSPTVDRLEHLGLTRPRANENPAMRRQMVFGNRLFLGRPGPGFDQTSLNDSIARSGWSWGCAAFDFDNDSFPDVYIANGHETKSSVREYEPEFWLHDLYIDHAVDELTASAYFLPKFARTRGLDWSYGGYEKNRFYLNQKGGSFVEIGHLMGLALEEDSRNVVADDLDGDGRVDLLVTTFEAWPEVKQTLRVYQNKLSGGGNWIGFRFLQEERALSPVGARVELQFNGHSAVRHLITGDSYRSQHANTLHFGLDQATRVESVKIRWPNGEVYRLRAPPLNVYHSVRGPGDGAVKDLNR